VAATAMGRQTIQGIGGRAWLKSRRYRRTLQWGSCRRSAGFRFHLSLRPLGGAKGASVDPSVKLRAKGVNGACAVVQLTVDGMPSRFSNAGRGDVALR